MNLRRWKPEDCDAIHAIANDPSVRAVSFSTDPIPLESHREWFARALDEGRDYYVVEVQGDVAGYVRFDGHEISIALAPEYRGQGLSVPAIREGCHLHVGPVVAYIRPGNEPSIRAFERAGFVFVRETTVKGHRSLEYHGGTGHQDG